MIILTKFTSTNYKHTYSQKMGHEYVEQKALNTLFPKVANNEKLIRTNPKACVNVVLQRVFGQSNKK